MTVEFISYDVRQMNFTPGELVGSMNTAANFLSCTGINPWWATNVWFVSTEPVAIDRWMDDGMIDEGHALLAKFVPAPGVVLVRIVKVRVGAEGREKRRLVIRRTAHPAVGHARPFGNGVAAGDEILDGLWRLEEGVRHSRIARVCRRQQLVLSLVVMQRVEQARHHPGGVAEGRMGGDVLDALAVDEDLAAVAQGFDVLRAGLRFGNSHLADVFRPTREGRAVATAVRFSSRRLGRSCHRDLPIAWITT